MQRAEVTHRRTVATVVSSVLIVGGASAIAVRADETTTLTPERTTITWAHGPLTATADTFTVTVDVPRDYWANNPGGVTFRIDTGNADAELDLAVADVDGNNLAVSRYGARPYQQVYLPHPPNADYLVTARGVSGGPGPAYTGTAQLVSWAAPQVPLTDGKMRFARSTVDAQILGNEPGIAVDPRGPVYVDVPNGFNNTTSVIWRSDDGAQTFHTAGATVVAGIRDPRRRPCGVSSGGGDIDVAVDRTGRVYFADLEDFAISAGYSTDRGNTWHCDPLQGIPLGAERPWLAAAPSADGSGPGIDAYIAYDDLASGQLPASATVSPQQVHVLATSDGGHTWTTRGSFGAGLVPVPGPLFVGSNGTVYNVFSGNDAVWLAESTDAGRTFSVSLISQRLSDPRGNGAGWTVGAVDAAGHLYAAWVDGGTGDVLYTRSADHGFSWSLPARVNPPGQMGIRPWLAVDGSDDVAIAWYGAYGDFLAGPGGPDGTRWYPYVARNTNAADPTSPFVLGRMSPVPVMVGFGDNVDVGSIAADFFKVVIGPNGRIYAAFCDAGRVPVASPIEVAPTVYSVALNAPPQPQPYVIVARQTAGVGLSAVTDRPHSAPAFAGPKPLRFLRQPSVTRRGNSFSVTFQLASTDLSAAINRSVLPATDAYWVVLMRTSTRQAYVVMRQSGDGAPTFLADDHPTGGIYQSTDECCATYPGVKPLVGHLDPKTGTVTITGPLAALHLRAGQRIYNVQAFSLIGRPLSVTRYNLLEEADVTGASTHTLT